MIRARSFKLKFGFVNEIMLGAAQHAVLLNEAADSEEAFELTQTWHEFISQFYARDHRSFDAYREIARICRDAASFSTAHNLHPFGTGGTMREMMLDTLFEPREELGRDFTALTGRWWEGLGDRIKYRTLKEVAKSHRQKQRKQKRKKEKERKSGNEEY
jgi:hypothetical protein